MSHIIKQLHIEKLFGTTNIDWELNPSVNVLVGQNGSGKSTILRLLESVLSQQPVDSLKLIKNCYIDLDNDIYFHYETSNVSQKSFLLHSINMMMEDSNLPQEVKDSFRKTDVFHELSRKDDESTEELTSSLKVFFHNTNENNLALISSSFKSNFVNRKKLLVEFISTINMSANSINSLITSSGQETTLLDIEITNEVQRLLSQKDNLALKEKLLSALNNLFAETQKTIEFNEKNSTNKLQVKLANGEEIPFNKLSSGERQVIFIFLKVVIASVDGALILMDEPEISLHLSWQEKLLNEIRRINTSSQIIIVTHSPAMLMNGWMDSFVDISNIMTDVSNDHPSE